MPKILKSHSIYYKDINLIAKPQNLISSRKEIPVELYRVFVSPMTAVVGPKFAEKALELGLQVCLHRFCDTEEQVKLFNYLKCSEYKTRLWAAIGLNDFHRFSELYQNGCRRYLIDIANGYLDAVVQYTKDFYENFPESQFMVGNVHSKEGVKLYKGLKGIYIRIGIGNGQACKTSVVAACNRGQVTELLECCPVSNKYGINTVSDGGIVTASDAVKAFGLGANYIMMGGYFSKAEEAQNVINGEYKFWGCASKYNQQKYGEVRRHSEGKVLDINKAEIKPLKELVADLQGGISSGVSYSGYSTLTDFIGKGTFEQKL
jgi:IMP dehydrogenase/GMP reductase